MLIHVAGLIHVIGFLHAVGLVHIVGFLHAVGFVHVTGLHACSFHVNNSFLIPRWAGLQGPDRACDRHTSPELWIGLRRPVKRLAVGPRRLFSLTLL